MKKSKSITTVSHRVHLFYSGRVQGVGFRYTAERIALELNLFGCVRNMPDGRVEVVCEGSKDKIDEFIRRIQETNLGSLIKKTQCVWEPPTHQFMDFSVEFYH